MPLTNQQRLIWESTYLSNIYEAEDEQGKIYIIKRNTAKARRDEIFFMHWLLNNSHPNLLIPFDVQAVNGYLEETYEKINLPLLDNIATQLFPFEGGTRYGWATQHALGVIAQITSALGHIHSQGFVHGDARARNIFVNPAGLEIKLFDYNSVSRPYFLLDGRRDIHYEVPPEYRAGSAEIDFTFDVYQAGKLFVYLTHDFKNRPRVQLNDDLLNFISKSTAGDKNERYRDCNEMHEDILRIAKTI